MQTQVKIKPEARKVELQVPIEHGPRLANYDDEADESIQLQDLTLASTQVLLQSHVWRDSLASMSSCQ